MKIVLPGEPIAQIRMKYSGRGGIGRMYDPRKREKDGIKRVIQQIFLGRDYFSHPRVSFIFHMPIPLSIPRKRLDDYQSGFLKHEKKPDVDNLIKLYLDCMDGILFDGDQKVSLAAPIKVYHPQPKTIILLDETSERLHPIETDPYVWSVLCGQEDAESQCNQTDSLFGFCNHPALTTWVSSVNEFLCRSIHTSS